MFCYKGIGETLIVHNEIEKYVKKVVVDIFGGNAVDFDTVTLSRLLTFITLGFHIGFATFGVSIPIFISAAEWIGVKKKDIHYLNQIDP